MYDLKLSTKEQYRNKILNRVYRLCSALFLLFVANLSLAGESSSGRDAEQYFFAQSFKDFQEELDLVQEENKQGVLVFFDMVGCPYCQYMKDTVLSQALVQEWYSQHFRSIRVDIHGATEVIDFDGSELTESRFATRYGVFSTPTIIYFNTKGNELYRHLKVVKTPEQFKALGQAVLAKNK